MNPFFQNKEIAITGSFFRTARLRHEGCDYFDDPPGAVEAMCQGKPVADILTFVPEIYAARQNFSFRREVAPAAVLHVTTFDKWWTTMSPKARNKIRKFEKAGAVIAPVELSDEFAKGVEAIYAESPIRQGRKFYHYGKKADAIKEELKSFLDRCEMYGAYYQGELIGFMKVFRGHQILRTVHILAKLSHRDKPVVDALLEKAVRICEANQIPHLQYGSWSARTLGDFKIKRGFERVEVPRYFAPLTGRGSWILEFNLHRGVRRFIPQTWIDMGADLRGKWNGLRFQQKGRTADA
jgi:hypothetical protein